MVLIWVLYFTHHTTQHLAVWHLATTVFPCYIDFMTYWSYLPYAIQILDLIRRCSHALKYLLFRGNLVSLSKWIRLISKLGVATLGSHVSKEGKSKAWEHSERQLGFLHVDQPQIIFINKTYKILLRCPEILPWAKVRPSKMSNTVLVLWYHHVIFMRP